MRLPAPDKVLHFAFGYLYACLGAAWGPLGALAAAAAVGLLREAYNLAKGAPWCWQDAAVTVAGGAPLAFVLLVT